MPEIKEINAEIVQQRIDEYIKNHQLEIMAEIDKKIGTAVRNAIQSYFKSGYGYESKTEDYIKCKIEEIAKSEVDRLQIDSKEIADKLKKKVEKKIRELEVYFN